MLINATVNIDLAGGIIPNGDSGSALITINPVAIVNPNPQVQASGMGGLFMGIGMNLNAGVIHKAEVDINPPPPAT